MPHAPGSAPRIIADPSQPRHAGPDRPTIDVAVGVLIRQDGRFLLTSRPEGKVYATYWEFPGGKLEGSESVQEALHRELLEELGVDIANATIWRSSVVDYPHALVHLHFCKVFQWRGTLCMREGQRFSWEKLPVQVSPILPGTMPVLEWLHSDAQAAQ